MPQVVNQSNLDYLNQIGATKPIPALRRAAAVAVPVPPPARHVAAAPPSVVAAPVPVAAPTPVRKPAAVYIPSPGIPWLEFCGKVLRWAAGLFAISAVATIVIHVLKATGRLALIAAIGLGVTTNGEAGELKPPIDPQASGGEINSFRQTPFDSIDDTLIPPVHGKQNSLTGDNSPHTTSETGIPTVTEEQSAENKAHAELMGEQASRDDAISSFPREAESHRDQTTTVREVPDDILPKSDSVSDETSLYFVAPSASQLNVAILILTLVSTSASVLTMRRMNKLFQPQNHLRNQPGEDSLLPVKQVPTFRRSGKPAEQNSNSVPLQTSRRATHGHENQSHGKRPDHAQTEPLHFSRLHNDPAVTKSQNRQTQKVEQSRLLHQGQQHLPVLSVVSSSSKPWTSCVVSIQGNVRKENEDAATQFRVGTEFDVMIIADGCGGIPHGAQASQTAVAVAAKAVKEGLSCSESPQHVLKSAFEIVSLRLAAEAAALGYVKLKNDTDRQKFGMRTTLIIVIASANVTYAGFIGDGAIYVIEPDGALHALLTPQRQEGRTNVLTASLGPVMHGEPEILSFERQPDSITVVCTDGVADRFRADEMIRALVEQFIRQNGECRQVIAEALNEWSTAADSSGDFVCDDNMTLGILLDGQKPKLQNSFWKPVALTPVAT